MGLINYVAAKLLGISTPGEYLKTNLAIFCNINNLQNLKKNYCYKLDKAPFHPSQTLYLQVHFCTALLDGKTVAVVIEYDEDSGYTCGSTIDLRSSLRHGLLARSYRNGDKSGSSFYLHVLNGVEESCSLNDTLQNE